MIVRQQDAEGRGGPDMTDPGMFRHLEAPGGYLAVRHGLVYGSLRHHPLSRSFQNSTPLVTLPCGQLSVENRKL